MQWFLLLILTPYFYLLLKIYMGMMKIRPYRSHITPGIFITIIVACRNEEKNIPVLLSDIAAQAYSHDLFEVIVVDDNSSDSTFETASAFREIKNLKVMRNYGKGKKSAIKTGVDACKGMFVVTTDADCRTGKEWLRTIASFLAENNPEMAVGPVKMESSKGFLRKFQELEFHSLQGVTAGTAASGNPVMCNGANLAFTRASFLKNSENLHFELVSGDDVFLLHGIKKERGKILWLESEDASVSTRSAPTLRSFLRQRARWISKARGYNDRDTKLLAIVTFVTILFQLSLLVAGVFHPVFLLVFAAGFILKSIPDFLILHNRTRQYEKKNLMRFFLQGQLIYPFYVISVLICYLFTKSSYAQSASQ